MLAKRLDPIEDYHRIVARGETSVYRSQLKRRKLSVHARFVAKTFEVFPGARILENVPNEECGGRV